MNRFPPEWRRSGSSAPSTNSMSSSTTIRRSSLTSELAAFKVVVFNNTNSTPEKGALLTADQRAAFQRYIRSGGGYVGIHSASGTERDWEWYGELMGAFFKVHPKIQKLTVNVEDPLHPSTRSLPKSWVRTEEPYDFLVNPSRPRPCVGDLRSGQLRRAHHGCGSSDHLVSLVRGWAILVYRSRPRVVGVHRRAAVHSASPRRDRVGCRRGGGSVRHGPTLSAAQLH